MKKKELFTKLVKTGMSEDEAMRVCQEVEDIENAVNEKGIDYFFNDQEEDEMQKEMQKEMLGVEGFEDEEIDDRALEAMDDEVLFRTRKKGMAERRKKTFATNRLNPSNSYEKARPGKKPFRVRIDNNYKAKAIYRRLDNKKSRREAEAEIQSRLQDMYDDLMDYWEEKMREDEEEYALWEEAREYEANNDMYCLANVPTRALVDELYRRGYDPML